MSKKWYWHLLDWFITKTNHDFYPSLFFHLLEKAYSLENTKNKCPLKIQKWLVQISSDVFPSEVVPLKKGTFLCFRGCSPSTIPQSAFQEVLKEQRGCLKRWCSHFGRLKKWAGNFLMAILHPGPQRLEYHSWESPWHGWGHGFFFKSSGWNSFLQTKSQTYKAWSWTASLPLKKLPGPGPKRKWSSSNHHLPQIHPDPQYWKGFHS